MKNVTKICKFARKLKNRRGDVIICLKDMTEEEVLVFFNYPDKVSNAPNCVATTMFSTGHRTPDSFIEIEKMYGCKDRAI